MFSPIDRTWIRVFSQFEAQHCWKNAPESEAYLRNPHRHMFFVTVEIPVYHDDRDVEFYAFKKYLGGRLLLLPKPMEHSCEQYCKDIATFLRRDLGHTTVRVCVSEDNLEGAIYEHIE